MRQRNEWTHEEDVAVCDAMRDAISTKQPLRDMADELSRTIPHPPTSILQRWYRVLSSADERVQGRTDTRVGWNTRLHPNVLAKLRAIADVKGWRQNETVACALAELVNGFDDATIDAITQRQNEILEAMR